MTTPAPDNVERDVAAALDEDVGQGDASATLIPADVRVTASVRCRDRAIVCGRPWFERVFTELDPALEVEWLVDDGDEAAVDSEICRLKGPARALLSGERTALNFLQLLSGTATLARRYRDAVGDRDVKLLDTRKTIPGLRRAQKYAVRCGGCDNHRLGLYDCVMLKENHIFAGGDLEGLVRRARAEQPDLPLVVEVESMEQLDRIAGSGADRALLDNFNAEQLRQAVRRFAGSIQLEASGNITLDNVREMAETGVHAISIGQLTKQVTPVDFSMRVTG